MADRFQHRRDTKERWAQINPILMEGEVGYELDTDQYKLGDGIRSWNDLPYRGDPCVQQEGTSTTTPMSQAAITEALKKRVPKTSFLNVSAETGNFTFINSEQARLAVPAASRGRDQILVYQTKEKVIVEYCTISNVTNDDAWKADSSWESVGSGGILNISEETNKYDYDNATSARAAVQDSDKKQGQLILYKLKTGWVYDFFIGADITNWNVDSNWVQIATSADLQTLNKLVNDTVKDINTSMTNLDKDLRDALKTRADGVRLTDENKLQLTSEGTDVGEAIELPSGILNLSYKENKEYTNSETARNTVKTPDRIIGQIITYKLNDGVWYLDQFVGETIGSWGNNGSWTQYALKRDLTPLLLDIEDLKIKFDSVNSAILGKIDGLESEDVDENNMAIIGTSNGVEVGRVIIPKGGGGTGPSTGVVMKMKAIGATTIVVSKGEDAILNYNWTSVDTEDDSETGPGTLTILVNNFAVMTDTINQGDNSINLKGYLNDGSNIVRIRVTDSYNNYRTLNYTIQVASLLLTSTFADDIFYDREPVQFRYVVQGTGTKTIRFWLNGAEIAPDVTDSTNKQFTKNLTGLVPGTNSIRVVAESTVGGYNLKSNEIYYEFINTSQGLSQPAIVISFNKTKVRQFEIVEIPFVIYDPDNQKARVELLVNNVLVQTLDVERTRQIWSYLAQEQGTFQLRIQCRGVMKAVTFEVEASEYDIMEEVGNLQYKGSAIGKSNSAADRASWKYGDYDAIFSDFMWTDDGWHRDVNGNNHLRLIGESKINVAIKPFGVGILQEGMTFTVEFATQDVVDPEAVIMSCFADGIGIEVKPNYIRLKSAQTEITANLDSSTKVSVSFVVQRTNQNRLLLLYIDGIMSGSIQFSSTDNLSQSSSPGFSVGTGDRACITMLYTIRWYNNSLDFNQIFGNYIFDIENFDEKVEKYQFNNILNDFGEIDYTKALDWLPCLTIVGDLPTFKGDKKNCDMLYEDKKNPSLSWSGKNIQNDVQGTSSQAYPRKNYKFKFQEPITMTETGQTSPTYSMLGTQIPAKVFCMKADFAESSGTHNTGMAVLVDEALRKLNYTIPPQANDERVRTTVFGYPCLIFHKQNESDAPTFLGKYNFNDDKSSTQVFGFQPGMECWEFLNNTSNICLFKGADWTSTIVNGKGETIPAWLNDLEGRYPDGNDNATNIKPLWSWVASCIGNPTKFKSECKNHFNEKWLVFYCLATELFGAIDQRAKNQMLTTYGEKSASGDLIWYFIFYDNDTIIGINNEGRMSFNYDIETKDEYGSSHVWNGWNSELWTLVEAAYQAELAELYAELRIKNAMSLDAALKIFQDRQSEKWCETVYNHDGQFKYIGPLVDDGDDSYLYALQGSRSRHRVWWLTNRFYYMDGKYFTGDYRAKFAHIRVNTPSGNLAVPAKVELNIRIGMPMYVRALVSSYQLSAGRGKTGQTYKLTPPNIQYNNTEVFIYGARGIKSLGDLSGAYPGESVNVVECVALEDLILGNTAVGYANNILKTLSLGNNTLLKTINVANCKVLNQALELGRCYSLKTVEARGSAITGVALPGKGVLETLNLPATVTAIYLKNQPNLVNFIVEGYAKLNTIVVDNTPHVDGYALVKQAVETTGNVLGKVRITNINAYDESSKTITALLGMSGEDANGNTTSTAVVTGKIRFASISQATLDRVRELFPELTVTYDVVLDVIEFEDERMKQLALTKYDSNKDGEISEDEVQFTNIPAGFLTNSGVVKFNEARYWGGTGTMINNCDTLTEVSIQAGKAELNTLPALKKLGIYTDSETLDTAPKFGYNTVQNCYSIEQFLLSGRYVETARKGIILAKQIINSIEVYRFVLPLKGYSALNIDERFYSLIDDAQEATFSWGSDVKSVTLKELYDSSFPVLPNLETLIINGTSQLKGKLHLLDALPVLQNLIINDTSGNNFTELVIENGVRNIDLRNIRCNSVSGSRLYIGGNQRAIQRIDMPESYKPAGIQLSTMNSKGQWTGSTPFAADAVLVIRSSTLIPLSMLQQQNGLITSSVSVYVPDGLVNAYKAAANWSQFAYYNKIFPLSNLG
ncbi:hypothetical protein M2132_001072 [Dysgonomonas sp. PH5-45]|uniref:hyaluronate lyase N-terminal domain-containing protein n=1 Tax=unclassified Dysgonomonas TaxID=2630389 RepID=UPI002474AA37|nr:MULTISPECIES: hypothetical protein [unclassified Dysgonomonas]MDH6354743.1 hypothetical protein [Dysgonomonas sp. PH5-45]MDH6387642.1 hypothetical protein [Dysgonomonas sp. PH5-37]